MGTTYYNTVNGRMISQKKNGVRTNFHTDALGSITTTTVNGAVENTYRYKPYGETLAKTGTAEDPRFLWTGDTGSRKTQAKASEHYNRARHYSNSYALWSTVDDKFPNELQYAYSVNNPTTFIDPSGNAIEAARDCYDTLCKYDIRGNIIGTYPDHKDILRKHINAACKIIMSCWHLPSCKSGFKTCATQDSQALERLECMYRKCTSSDYGVSIGCGDARCHSPFTGWPPFSDYPCAITHPGRKPCRISICMTERLGKRCHCDPLSGNIYEVLRNPSCHPTIPIRNSIIHELTHCCGMKSGAADVGDHIFLCIIDNLPDRYVWPDP